MTLTHKGTTTIETERLVLRRFELTDADAMFNNWANDVEVCNFVNFKPHRTIDVTKEVIFKWVNSYSNIEIYNWAIVPKEYGKAIGSISIVEAKNNNLACEIGYAMSKNYWNKGIMTEALKAVMNYLFSEVGYNRIQTRHDTQNPASGRVMEKSGMKLEGTMRQDKLRKNDTFGDRNIWALLRKEWCETYETA